MIVPLRLTFLMKLKQSRLSILTNSRAARSAAMASSSFALRSACWAAVPVESLAALSVPVEPCASSILISASWSGPSVAKSVLMSSLILTAHICLVVLAASFVLVQVLVRLKGEVELRYELKLKIELNIVSLEANLGFATTERFSPKVGSVDAWGRVPTETA